MIGQQQFRNLMAAVCAPVTVVTTTVEGVPAGATVSSFASLSLDPPMISVAFDRRSMLLEQIRRTDRFGVNLLAHTQEEIARLFARRGVDRFAGIAWHQAEGLPRLDEAAGWMVCDLRQTVEAGDHLLLFGLVAKAAQTDCAPLVYAHRTFGTHSRYAQRPRKPITDQIAALAR